MTSSGGAVGPRRLTVAVAVPAVALLLVACSATHDPPPAPAAVEAPSTSPDPTGSDSSSATIAYTRAEASRLDPRHEEPNGCPVRHAWEPRLTSPPKTVNVCAYEHGLIILSELLTGDAATAAVAAIRRAPVRAAHECPLEKIAVPAIDLITPRGTATLVWWWCTGLDWRSARREITAEVLYWALSPGNHMHLPGRVAVAADVLGLRRH
jgi:hypothetical protein